MENRVNISPSVLRWAIEESGLNEQTLSKKYPRLSSWLSGDAKPTYKQLNTLSATLNIPAGYLFLVEPPQRQEIPKEFRTINNINARISKDLKDTLYEMEFKKNWMSDFRKEHGWSKLEFVGLFHKKKTPPAHEVIEAFFKHTQIPKNWYSSSANVSDAYAYLRNKFEDVGILIMQNGVVGQNTRKPLNVSEFRAFVLADEYAPLIFINRKDSCTGRIFSLVHEFVHLLFGSGNIATGHDLNDERLINKYTADILMPDEYLNRFAKWGFDQIQLSSNEIKVSPLALAIKLNSTGVIDDDLLESVRSHTNENVEKKGMGGGNYYYTKASRLGNTFPSAVISQVESGNIRYTDAYRLLGIRGDKIYKEYRDRMMR